MTYITIQFETITVVIDIKNNICQLLQYGIKLWMGTPEELKHILLETLNTEDNENTISI